MGGCIGITRSGSGPIEESSATVSRPNSGGVSDHLSPWRHQVRVLITLCCCRRFAEEPVAVPRDHTVEIRRAIDRRTVT